MVKLDRVEHTITLSEGVTADIADSILTISKESKSLSREFVSDRVELFKDGGGLIVRCNLPRRSEKALAGTWAAHIRNMNKGVSDGFTYKMKVVYSHFPMSLKVEGSQLVVNNYFGEKVPRRANILEGVTVTPKGKSDVIVEGMDKENVGQTVANIERACSVKNRDRRVFQDGIYLVEKF